MNSPLFTMVGPDDTNVEQKINIVTDPNKQHTFFFYDEYAGEAFPSITDWVGTSVIVDGVGIAAISHTVNRVGQIFGYNSNGTSVPEYTGTLQDCKDVILTRL
jgi:hypothetical protein